MGNKSKVKIVISILVIIFALIGLGIMIFKDEIANMRVVEKAVVVRVDERSMLVYNNDSIGFCRVGFTRKGNIGFKKGQEVLIYYSGYMVMTMPGQIYAGKIKVLKEQSNIEIPEELLKYAYNSRNNVSLKINKFTKNGLEFTITDTNELPYRYNDNLEIYKRNVENELHNASLEIDQNRITPATENSTSAYNPDMSLYKPEWEKLGENSLYINKENIGELSIASSKNPLIVEGRYDWSKVYGELTDGEYEIRIMSEFYITIKFTINDDGEVTYSEPILTF